MLEPIDRNDLIKFAHKQQIFGTIIKHRIETKGSCDMNYPTWKRTQYDTFIKSNRIYYRTYDSEYDNVNNMTVEWHCNDHSTLITSKIMDPYLKFNDNMEIDPYTVFKYIFDKTKDINVAWDYSRIDYCDYETITWLMELFMQQDNEDILETYKDISDEFNLRYQYENNTFYMIDHSISYTLNKRLRDLCELKIEVFSNFCLSYTKL